jgi:hypothetical protein
MPHTETFPGIIHDTFIDEKIFSGSLRPDSPAFHGFISLVKYPLKETGSTFGKSDPACGHSRRCHLSCKKRLLFSQKAFQLSKFNC